MHIYLICIIITQLREFIAGNELSLIGKAGMKNFRQAEETTAVNVHWMETNYEDIKQWLEEAVSGDWCIMGKTNRARQCIAGA